MFALFHDARRRSEGSDREHGRRGAALARQLHAALGEVTDTQLALLCEACEGHTDGHITTDVTVAVCWDADRLDLGRVGIRVRPKLLSTEAARDPVLLAWARERSEGEVVLPIVGAWMAAVAMQRANPSPHTPEARR